MIDVYALTLSWGIDDDGDVVYGLAEDGELDMATKLGLLRLAEDTLLHGWDDEEISTD